MSNVQKNCKTKNFPTIIINSQFVSSNTKKSLPKNQVVILCTKKRTIIIVLLPYNPHKLNIFLLIDLINCFRLYSQKIRDEKKKVQHATRNWRSCTTREGIPYNPLSERRDWCGGIKCNYLMYDHLTGKRINRLINQYFLFSARSNVGYSNLLESFLESLLTKVDRVAGDGYRQREFWNFVRGKTLKWSKKFGK